jgi:opacity protein-like surface antigen
VGFGLNYGFDSNLKAIGFSYRESDLNTPRVGFGYDIAIKDKWIFSPSVQLDVNRSETETFYDESATGLQNSFKATFIDNSDLEYIIAAPFYYAIYSDKKSILSLGAGPQFAFNFNKILGGRAFRLGTQDGSILSYQETNVINNTLRISGLLSVNYTSTFGKTPVRIEAFYAHSFENQKSGSFSYINNFNGQNQTGDYSFKAHKVGLALSIFAFGHGKKAQMPAPAEIKVKEKVLSERGFDPELQWGFKAGYSEGDIAAVDTIDGDLSGVLEASFYMGFYVTKPMDARWAIRSEFLYSSIENNHIIQVPIQAQYSVLNNLSVFVGPNINYIFLLDEISDIVDKRVGLGIDGGIEYHFSKTFFAEARYNYGLTHQFNDPELDYKDGRYSSLRFGIGVRF